MSLHCIRFIWISLHYLDISLILDIILITLLLQVSSKVINVLIINEYTEFCRRTMWKYHVEKQAVWKMYFCMWKKNK